MRKNTNRRTKSTLTPRELAAELGIGTSNTYKLLADGTIPSIRVGNRFFTPRVALEKWLESCGNRETGK
jgi:excisionase family DNA binding protein